MERVKLFVYEGQWYVDWAETQRAGYVKGLFGTTQIPTPFFANMPYNKVQALLQAKNEDVEFYDGREHAGT